MLSVWGRGDVHHQIATSVMWGQESFTPSGVGEENTLASAHWAVGWEDPLASEALCLPGTQNSKAVSGGLRGRDNPLPGVTMEMKACRRLSSS